MSGTQVTDESISEGRLVELYHRYVGEPERMRDVYGYWIFLVGTLAGIFGVVVYLFEALALSGDVFGVRQVAIALAALGLAFLLFGILVLLPVRKRGMQVSVLGLVVSIVGIAAFTQVYPSNWYGASGTTYTAEVIAIYTGGLTIIAAVAVLVPVVTGEKGLLVEPELGIDDDSPPILVGDADRDAFFAVYQRPENDWTWRVLRRDAIARAASPQPSDTDARMAIESLRDRIGDAGLLEITTAAFRLYRTEDGQWRWSLVRDDGSVVAESDGLSAGRDDAESTANFLKGAAPAANVIDIRGAAFDVFEDDRGRWRWRLVDDRRQPLARSGTAFDAESVAKDATDEFVDLIDDVRLLDFESVAVELFAENGSWRWRVVDGDDRRLLESADAFDSRRDAESAATDVAGRMADAPIVERGTPGYEVYSLGDVWRWRLRDETDDLIATAREDAADEAAAVERAERAAAVVGDAELLEFRGADYEVYPAGGEWHWRLVADDRTVLADSTEGYEEREGADEGADRVREQALAADLIEFEQAAFQQYESGGEWRWRLIDEDGRVMADSGESYASKEDVMDGMTTLKENAPDAELLEIETAAFEIYLTEGQEYAWRLIDEGGQQIAESAETYPSRAAARDAVEYLLENLDDADVRGMERAAFQLRSDDESWGWWLVDTDGTVLAEGADSYPTRDDAEAAIDAMREAGDDADVDVFGPANVQLVNGGSWHWRLIDRDREPIAETERSYDGRGDVLDDVALVTNNAAEAPVFELGDGVLRATPGEDGWTWELFDGDRELVASGPEPYEGREALLDAVERIRTRAPDADDLDYDTAAFELSRDEDDDWRWRVIDEDEAVLAVSAAGYASRDDVKRSIDETRDLVGGASILEIDESAFEFHEVDGGWIWRLVDENGEALVESAHPHDTRREAREEMLDVKAHAPDGETVVTW